jgi:hypothetical protein
MPRKKSKTHELLEAKVLYKHDGKIDLKKLWEKEVDKELDPEVVRIMGGDQGY